MKRRLLGLGEPVALGGTLIRPGDWVVVDHDGVCVLPGERLDAVLAAAESRRGREDAIREALRAGETTIAALGLGPLLERWERRTA